MCGRVSLHYTWAEIHAAMSMIPATADIDLVPRYNVGRFQHLPVIMPEDDRLVLKDMLWEFVPSWWQKPLKDKSFSTFNARAETVREAKSYAEAWRNSQRVLIPASGFYEWPRPAKRGQPPYFITRRDEALMVFAGLANDWTDPETGKVTSTVAMITTEPNQLMRDLPHHRCPVVLEPEQYDFWLDARPDDAFTALKPPTDDALKAHRVGSQVNRIGYNGEDCITPKDVEPTVQQDLFG